MVRPYSLDLRERVVAAVESGQSCRAVAETFGVSVASVVKWSQRHRATGSAAPNPMGGKRPVLLAGQRAYILERIEQIPEISLRALAAELKKRGIVVSYGAVWSFGHRERLNFKKNRAGACAQRRRGAAHWRMRFF
ncbi:MAG: transposase [Hyphomicrobium sp.]|nr:transposase [Hyphomicrobium sp.]